MATLVLNGTSSAGKTSLARALQDAWPGPLQVSGLDTFLGCQGRQMFAVPGAAPSDGFTWERRTVELDEVERRERERGDRLIGQARGIGAVVHDHRTYDVEVDTSLLSPEQAGAVVLAAVEARQALR